MKVWLLGATGMLGCAIVDTMRKNKVECCATTQREVDITSLKEVEDFAMEENFSHIINCAAYTNVDKAEEEAAKAYAVNTKGPSNIGAIATKVKAKVIHFSSDYVFDGTNDCPYEEDDVTFPCNAYGQTKLEGENLLLKICPTSCVIRTSWLFGLHGNNFVSNMLKLMQKKEEISVVEDQFGRPTSCKDLAEAVFDLLPYNGIFHFANSDKTSWYELARAAFNEAQELGFKIVCQNIIPIKTYQYPTIAKRPQYSVLSTKKYEKTCDITPRLWQDSLKEYLKEYFHTLWQ
jgi:dTDP-4-dehydrorhamnose reductase